MAGLSSRFAKLNPFADLPTFSKHQDADDVGDVIDANSKAGGGFAGQKIDEGLSQLRISPALRSFVATNQILSAVDAGVGQHEGLTDGLRWLLSEPLISIPPEITDRSYPLPSYFVSSSHNTYLTAHQLYGSASDQAYKTALEAGSRCVEIDAWDGDDPSEPKVTHGYTLTSHILFRSVCHTIREFVDKESAIAVERSAPPGTPILLSLENHCSPSGQQRLVDIMLEIFEHRLLSKAVRDKGHREQCGTGDHVTLAELENKIAVIVEYHFPGEPHGGDGDSDSISDSSEDEKHKQARREYNKKREETAAVTIIPELAELGVYAQSVKPPNNLWYEEGQLRGSPHHPLINLSETGLGAHMPQHNQSIIRHNANHLMRVYPKGTRISSRNLAPVIFWGLGAQICALNWQTFDTSVQLNEALFTGTDGYVLKPASLRNGMNGVLPDPARSSKKKRLRLHIAGASDIPLPPEREPEDLKPYLTCTLIHPSDIANKPPKKKSSVYKPSKLGFLHHSMKNTPPTDPIWDETLEWEYEDNDLVFLRLLIKSDDAWAKNPIFTVNAVRLSYVVFGQWRFLRMLDLKGHPTVCSLLLKFEIEDA